MKMDIIHLQKIWKKIPEFEADLWSDPWYRYYVLLFYIEGKYYNYYILQKKNKKNTSGETAVRWEFFDICADIFATDKTINIGPTISSIINNPTENEITTFATPNDSYIPNDSIENSSSSSFNDTIIIL